MSRCRPTCPVAELVPMVLELVGRAGLRRSDRSRGGCSGPPASRCRPVAACVSSACWTASCCGSPRTGPAPPAPVFDDPVDALAATQPAPERRRPDGSDPVAGSAARPGPQRALLARRPDPGGRCLGLTRTSRPTRLARSAVPVADRRHRPRLAAVAWRPARSAGRSGARSGATAPGGRPHGRGGTHTRPANHTPPTSIVRAAARPPGAGPQPARGDLPRRWSRSRWPRPRGGRRCPARPRPARLLVAAAAAGGAAALAQARRADAGSRRWSG